MSETVTSRIARKTFPFRLTSLERDGLRTRRADPGEDCVAAYRRVRGETERRAAPLGAEDQLIQAMPDASPTKWHRAHTSWFFEEFILKAFAENYRVFDADFAYLFNSYYDGVGPYYPRARRGLITRPTADEVGLYRAHVDEAMQGLLRRHWDDKGVLDLVALGLNHEQQHQELILTDILAAYAQNPAAPAYDLTWQEIPIVLDRGVGAFVEVSGGKHNVGDDAHGFAFDNERPVHGVWLEPMRISQSLVTNNAWLDFMRDGGYETPTLWLSDGWAAVKSEAWRAPGYWVENDGVWCRHTLAGLEDIHPHDAVCHVSYYEAEAFARWSGARLPTEAEWEISARSGDLRDAFGRRWQWTQSAYGPYPRFRPQYGAVGEYNGKFMANQMVLRGSSFATPKGHARASYRNYFYPHQRWQFTGVRLAYDI